MLFFWKGTIQCCQLLSQFSKFDGIGCWAFPSFVLPFQLCFWLEELAKAPFSLQICLFFLIQKVQHLPHTKVLGNNVVKHIQLGLISWTRASTSIDL